MGLWRMHRSSWSPEWRKTGLQCPQARAHPEVAGLCVSEVGLGVWRVWAGPQAPPTCRGCRTGCRPCLPPGACATLAAMGRLLPASYGKDGWGAGMMSLLPTWRRAGPGWARCLPGCVCQLAPFGHQQGLLGLAGIPGCQGILGGRAGWAPSDHVWVTLGLVPAPSPGRPPGPASVAATPAKSATSPVRVSGLGCGWVRSSAPGPQPPPPLTTPSSPAAP